MAQTGAITPRTIRRIPRDGSGKPGSFGQPRSQLAAAASSS
jgi:hypothetical protein